MSWALFLHLKQNQSIFSRAKIRKLVPNLPDANLVDKDQYSQCRYVEKYFFALRSEFSMVARRTAERHRRENSLISNLRYALETSGTLLDAANYINS